MLHRNDQGSIPELVMRTGVIRTMDPSQARQDIMPQHVLNVTSGHGISTMYDQPIAQPSPVTTAVAQTVVATPPTPIATPTSPLHGGVMLGSHNGRPVAAFNIAAAPQAYEAQGAVAALRKAAQAIQNIGQGTLPPELIGGPLAALMRGGAIELHFQNGVVTRTAL